MKNKINQLVWKLPVWVHDIIYSLFGYELVEYVNVSFKNIVNHPNGLIEYQNCSMIGNEFRWVKIELVEDE